MADNSAVIGALSVIIGGDASALDKMLKGAQSSVSGFAKNIAGIAGGIGLEKALSGAISAFTGGIEKALADAEALNKMSQSTGETVEQLSKLKYAADLSGVSSDTLAKSLQGLSVGLSDLASGKVTPAATALEAIGIAAKNADGSVKTSGQALLEVADKFAGYKDGANKAALAQQLFGAGGEAMIALLNKGSAGIADLGAEAAKYGLVLDNQTRAAVEAFNDNLKKMDAIKQGLYATITAELLPTFERLSSVMLDLKQNSGFTATAADLIARAMRGLATEIALDVGEFQNAVAWIKAIKDLLTDDFATSGGMAGVWEKFSAATEAADANLAALKTTIGTVAASMTGVQDFAARFDDGTAAIKKTVAEMDRLQDAEQDQIAAPYTKAIGDTANALQTFLDKEAKATAGVEAQAQAVGLGADAQARLKVQLEAVAIAKAKDIALTEDWKNKINAAANAAAAAAQTLAGNQLTQASLAPWEQRNILLGQYNALLNAGKISSETFSVASQKLQFPNFTAAKNTALDFNASMDTLATSGINGVASAFAQAAAGQKSFGDAFSAAAVQFGVQILEMIARALIFKAIMTAIGFVGGGPVDSNAANLAAGIQPLASGGFVSGPGSGTSDSIPAMLSNGEFVINAAQTRKYAPLLNAINLGRVPAYAGGGMVSERVSSVSVPSVPFNGGAPAMATVQMQGEVFTRATLAKVIDGLNGMFANGYRLKLS